MEEEPPIISRRLVETVVPLPILEDLEINNNPAAKKYDFTILNEVDDLPYFDIVETRNQDNAEDKFFIDLYERLLKKRNLLCRVQDQKSGKKFAANIYTVAEDIEFYTVLREIAIAKYVQFNIDGAPLKLGVVFPNNNNSTSAQ